MRKLVTIREVEDINPINGADAIECLSIGGWKVVSRKGTFEIGDSAVFFEIDSFLPASDVRFEDIFQGKGKRTFEGVDGYRLRTVKLRGQISQGLALPLNIFPEIAENTELDITEQLGVIKYERPEDFGGNCITKGYFPWFIHKTDEERVQNISQETWDHLKYEEFVPTLKLCGASTTVYYVKDERYFIGEPDGRVEQVGLCSRKFLLDWESNTDNPFVKGVMKSGLFNIATQMGRDLNKNIALQGETVGGGIQNGWEKFAEFETFVFSIFDLDEQRYFSGLELLHLVSKYNIPSTVFYKSIFPFRDFTRDELIKMADGSSFINNVREGLVFKQLDGPFSFKVISNKFLLKGGE
jgi:RNA ligase (TIGR02306 family)